MKGEAHSKLEFWF